MFGSNQIPGLEQPVVGRYKNIEIAGEITDVVAADDAIPITLIGIVSGSPTENFAESPSIEGDDWPSVIVETALPMPAAQIWPSRPEPAANLAE
jgi:hypothetical protein